MYTGEVQWLVNLQLHRTRVMVLCIVRRHAPMPILHVSRQLCLWYACGYRSGGQPFSEHGSVMVLCGQSEW